MAGTRKSNILGSFNSLFRRASSESRLEKAWAVKFGEIEKLVKKKKVDELETRLEELTSWMDSCKSGELHPEWLNQAGLICQAYTGDFSRAEKCFKKALEISEEQGEPREKALAMTNLGVLYLDQNRSAEAVDLFLGLKPFIEEQFGAESPETVTVCQNLAQAYRLNGKEEEARQERIRATGILRKLSS